MAGLGDDIAKLQREMKEMGQRMKANIRFSENSELKNIDTSLLRRQKKVINP